MGILYLNKSGILLVTTQQRRGPRRKLICQRTFWLVIATNQPHLIPLQPRAALALAVTQGEDFKKLEVYIQIYATCLRKVLTLFCQYVNS